MNWRRLLHDAFATDGGDPVSSQLRIHFDEHPTGATQAGFVRSSEASLVDLCIGFVGDLGNGGGELPDDFQFLVCHKVLAFVILPAHTKHAGRVSVSLLALARPSGLARPQAGGEAGGCVPRLGLFQSRWRKQRRTLLALTG